MKPSGIDRTCELPTCCAVPQPTAPPRAPKAEDVEVEKRYRTYKIKESTLQRTPLCRQTLPLITTK